MALTDATVSARSSLARQQFCVGEGGGLGEGRDTGEIVLAEKKNQGEATHTQTIMRRKRRRRGEPYSGYTDTTGAAEGGQEVTGREKCSQVAGGLVRERRT